MRIYKIGTILSAVISIAAVIAAFMIQLVSGFAYDVLIGIFGSGFLVMVTSLIGYWCEKRNTLIAFCIQTKSYADFLGKYRLNLDSGMKMALLMDICDFDLFQWNLVYSSMDFFSRKEQKYMKENIYEPLINTRDIIIEKSPVLRQKFIGFKQCDDERLIREIENELTNSMLEKQKDQNVLPVVEKIETEMNGRYLRLMQLNGVMKI